jgi:hypothetical protein
MDVQGMLAELKLQRRRLNRAISALEALQRTPRLRKKVRGAGKLREGVIVELRNNGISRRKNGTTGQLIPFLPSRDQS